MDTPWICVVGAFYGFKAHGKPSFREDIYVYIYIICIFFGSSLSNSKIPKMTPYLKIYIAKRIIFGIHVSFFLC